MIFTQIVNDFVDVMIGSSGASFRRLKSALPGPGVDLPPQPPSFPVLTVFNTLRSNT